VRQRKQEAGDVGKKRQRSKEREKMEKRERGIWREESEKSERAYALSGLYSVDR
jgi:hypothetical protein